MATSYAQYVQAETDPIRKAIILTILSHEPGFQYIQFQSITGLSYAYRKTVSLPQVQWRKINEAYTATSGVVNKEVEALKICGFDSDTDNKLISAYGKDEIKRRNILDTHAMSTSFMRQFFYGNSGARTGNAYDDDDAFDGIIPRLTSGQEVDAGGTSSTLGSSVFAVRFEDPYCVGLQDQPMEIEDFGHIAEKPVHRLRFDWAAGFAIMHGKSVARIKNLDTTQTLAVADMDDLRALIEGGQPSCYFMSFRSHNQLKTDAYTNYSFLLPTGMDQLGNPVSMWDGKPIIITDAILNTEDNTA